MWPDVGGCWLPAWLPQLVTSAGLKRSSGRSHRSTNPGTSGSCGSIENRCSPVRYAVPVTWGMTAGRPSTSTVSSTVPVNVLPTMESATGGGHRHVAGYHPAGNVDEVDGDHTRVFPVHPCGHPPRWHVDHHVDAAGLRGRDSAGFHGPGPQRDGAVPAGGRETVLMPKQHAQVSAVVVRRHDESAVHVRMAARF